MPTFLDVPENEISAIERNRGGDSMNTLNAFLDTNKYAVQLQIETGGDEKMAARTAGTLSVYARNNGLPARAIARNGKVYLRRLDVTKDGQSVPNWKASAPSKNGASVATKKAAAAS